MHLTNRTRLFAARWPQQEIQQIPSRQLDDSFSKIGNIQSKCICHKIRDTFSQLISETRMKIAKFFQFLRRLPFKTVVSSAPLALRIFPPDIHRGNNSKKAYRTCCPQVETVAFVVIRGIGRQVCPLKQNQLGRFLPKPSDEHTTAMTEPRAPNPEPEPRQVSIRGRQQ